MIAAVSALLAATWLAADPPRVEFAGGDRTEEVEVVEWDRDGATFGVVGNTGEPRRRRWDELRFAEGFPAELAANAETGVRLWRARTRLDRGDRRLAQPEFELFAESFRGEGSIRERLAVEGALRCRGEAGDLAGAIEMALRALALDRAGTLLPADSLRPASRPEPLGWPDLAPPLPLAAVLGGEESAAFLKRLEAFQSGPAEAEADAIASACLAMQRARSDPRDSGGDSPDRARSMSGFLAGLAALGDRPVDELLEGRDASLASAPTAATAQWRQAHLAERLLAEKDVDLRRRGLLEWLAIAAAAPETAEASWALRRAALAAAELGDDGLGDDGLAERLEVLAASARVREQTSGSMDPGGIGVPAR